MATPRITPGEATQILSGLEDATADFHSLRSDEVQYLLESAKEIKYRHPKNAKGSTARYFYSYLQSRAKSNVWGGRAKKNPKRRRKIIHVKRNPAFGRRKRVTGAGTGLRKQYLIELLHKDYGIWYVKLPEGKAANNTTQNIKLASRFNVKGNAEAGMKSFLANMHHSIKKNFVWIRVRPA